MKANEVAALIGCSEENVTKSKNVFTYRIGFFYKHGNTSLTIADRVKAKIPHATIVDHGEIYKAFNGGAPLKKSSHWWVKFTVEPNQ